MDQEVINRLLQEEVLFMLVGGTIACTAIVGGTVAGIIKSVTRERTRREIAAYIAEGSMSPEQGERLMYANRDKKC